MSRHPKKPSDAELLQGTLDILILKIVTLRPIHGYAIVQPRVPRARSGR